MVILIFTTDLVSTSLVNKSWNVTATHCLKEQIKPEMKKLIEVVQYVFSNIDLNMFMDIDKDLINTQIDVFNLNKNLDFDKLSVRLIKENQKSFTEQLGIILEKIKHPEFNKLIHNAFKVNIEIFKTIISIAQERVKVLHPDSLIEKKSEMLATIAYSFALQVEFDEAMKVIGTITHEEIKEAAMVEVGQMLLEWSSKQMEADRQVLDQQNLRLNTLINEKGVEKLKNLHRHLF